MLQNSEERRTYFREYMRKYRAAGHDQISARRHHDKVYGSPGELAKRKVNGEVAAGRLPRVKTLSCVDCGKTAECYDHRDYSKPMDVVPVCTACNYARGPALNNPLPTGLLGRVP